MEIVSAINDYFNQKMAPKIKEMTSLDDFIVVIGGSVSYGFADELSDVDVYIIWELPREIWFESLRQYLFTHQVIDGRRVQFIPLMLKSGPYSSLSYLLHGEYDKLKECDTKLIYDIQHYIPIHDTKGHVNEAKEYISSIEYDFWKEQCIEHCEKCIDVLEVFYSSSKRGNVITVSMHFGKALEGLMQIAYLLSGRPYPTTKWLWNGLEEANNEVYEALKQYFGEKLPCTCKELTSCILSLTKIVIVKLREKDIVPSYIIEDMLNP